MLQGSTNHTIGGTNAFNKKTLDSLTINPPLPIIFSVIKKSITKLIKAVFINNATDYF